MAHLTPISTEELEQLEYSRQATLAAFTQIDETTLLELSRLTLPQIREIQQEIAHVFPARNLPALVLSGLLKLRGRRVDSEQVRRDLSALLRGIDVIPQGLYGVFVAGPAAALYAYQKLLQLAGKDLTAAFPQGTWQFYLQFGLREDTARHAVETTGFHAALAPQADPAVMAAAWVCAALELVYGYDDLLAADWTERVMLRVIAEEAGAAGLGERPPFTRMDREWDRLRPYHCPGDGPDYFPYRTAALERFLQPLLAALPPDARARARARFEERQGRELAAYQEQMTLLAALSPDRHREQKETIPLWQASIGLVWQGFTYLLPACATDEQGSPLCYPGRSSDPGPRPLYTLRAGELCDTAGQPLVVDRSGAARYRDDGQLLGYLRFPPPDAILGWVRAILAAEPPGPEPALDLLLAQAPRALRPQVWDALPSATQADLAALRRAPVVVNWDLHAHDAPLARIRLDHRGIGDHALTLLRTDRSVVIDQSHVFFDGLWGMAVAEVAGGFALRWYRYLDGRAAMRHAAPPAPLALAGAGAAHEILRPHLRPGEAAAESADVDTKMLFRLCGWLAQRGVSLTVNDLLLLYRSFHAAQYELSAPARRALDAFRLRTSPADAQPALQALEATLQRAHETNPALLIPMDASNVAPRERVFPTTFRNPLTDLPDRFLAVRDLGDALDAGAGDWAAFDEARRDLLAYLQAFGSLLDALKAVTKRGESFNTATLRLLAHLPPPLQHLLDQIPQHIGVLNEIVKGNEVFSNVGRVAPGASLTRFISAKDDGQAKELVWGVLTDDSGRMSISLRDFRPFVPLLLALGEKALADLLAQDYLDSYVHGFNRFVADLGQIVSARPDHELHD